MMDAQKLLTVRATGMAWKPASPTTLFASPWFRHRARTEEVMLTSGPAEPMSLRLG